MGSCCARSLFCCFMRWGPDPPNGRLSLAALEGEPVGCFLMCCPCAISRCESEAAKTEHDMSAPAREGTGAMEMWFACAGHVAKRFASPVQLGSPASAAGDILGVGDNEVVLLALGRTGCDSG